MKIYLVRHGETDWNKSGRWQGLRDIPLNQNGILQSERLAYAVSELGICRIYSSPLKRAAETAGIVNERINTGVFLDTALSEIDCGEWAGLTPAEMKDKYRGLFTEWDTNEKSRVGYGVESYDELGKRAVDFVERVCESDKRPFLAVTHGTWIRTFICGIIGIPVKSKNSFEISNCGINIIDYNDGEFKIFSLNSGVG